MVTDELRSLSVALLFCIFESTREHWLFSLAILTYLADKPACMQLSLTWTVGTFHHSKLLHPCRTDQRSNKDKLYGVKRGKTEDREAYAKKAKIFQIRFCPDCNLKLSIINRLTGMLNSLVQMRNY